MQSARLPGALGLVLALGCPLRADTIAVPEVEVRSGPSPQYYATSKLRQGDKVTVVREQGEGWLAIAPPADSFDWINISLVERTGPYARVMSDDAVVWVGSRLLEAPPKVRGSKLQRGTQLVVIGEPLVGMDGTWLPIAPPFQEVRYIPAHAVQRSSPVQASAPLAATTPPPTSPAPPMTAAVAPATTVDPLWIQAEEAERVGNYGQAQQLYQDLARKTADADLQFRCYNRIQHLRERLNTAVSPPPLPGRPANAPLGQAVVDRRGQPGSALAPPPHAAPQGRAFAQYGPANYLPAAPQAPASVPVLAPPPIQPAAAASSTPPGQWSGPGRLYRAPFTVGGVIAYGLESSQGEVLMYITPQPGVNLDAYVNRNVSVFGSVTYRGDLRKNYMMALQVQPLN